MDWSPNFGIGTVLDVPVQVFARLALLITIETATSSSVRGPPNFRNETRGRSFRAGKIHDLRLGDGGWRMADGSYGFETAAQVWKRTRSES